MEKVAFTCVSGNPSLEDCCTGIIYASMQKKKFRGPASSQLYNTGGGGGGGGGGLLEKKNFFFAQITAKAFSYPHTEFGARRSMRVGVRSATN